MGSAYTQNLVLNGSFETAAECPLTGKFDFFDKGPCKDWTCPSNGTPDYYTAICGFAGSLTTTNNSIPQHGSAFAGIYTYGKFTNMYNREYIEGRLSSTLSKGHTYYVKFYVKPILNDRFSISSAVQNMGIFFSPTLINTTDDDLVLRAKPQVINISSRLNDTTGWTEISGCFTAKGNENYFLIGNFETDENSQVLPVKGSNIIPSMGYMLIDNVAVEEINKTELFTENQGAICAGDTVKLTVNTGKFDGFIWNDGITQTDRFLTNQGTYILQASYQNNCKISDTFTLVNKNCNPCHFWLPDAFTPDENTRNEVFKLSSDCVAKMVRLSIFNRWGDKVLDITSPDPAWDGKFLGEPASQGFYIYKCEILYEYNGQNVRKILNGTVTVLR